MAQIEAKPDTDAVTADAFDIERFAEIHARGLLTRGTLAPLSSDAEQAAVPVCDGCSAELLERAKKVLQQVADERGTSVHAVLIEVGERLARGVFGVETDVVGGDKG